MKLPSFLGLTILIALTTLAIAQQQSARRPMRTFDTPYYTLSTNIDDSLAREADLRMTRIFEEYRRRTAAFSVPPKGKLPFYLYATSADYYAAGGMKDSAGCFVRSSSGSKLLACAEHGDNPMTWHIIQHEAFHQFAAATIRAELPTWLNEGLAEYFGESLFTGDCFIVGIIPPYRLERVKEELTGKKWKSFANITTIAPEVWAKQMDITNYDQVWAMVHFLVHGEDGKYVKAFDEYLRRMNNGTPPADAWAGVFGKDVVSFQQKCEKWWSELPENPTREAYVRAIVATMTSLLAREELQKRKIDDFAGLLAAPKPTDVKLSRDMWLPATLVDGVSKVAKGGDWQLERPKGGGLPRLSCVVPQIGTVTGTFTLSGNRVSSVTVTVTKEKEGG
ncbi:MAG: DUF1570 domain-containing protein [Phycisphaerales bacterium]|nr:DUF1570 domain-containing protein [Phycisphaerales bacterium]